MEPIRPPQIRHYPTASTIEWVEANGVGGLSSSSVVGANTRKQHGLLSIIDGSSRLVLVASLQETISCQGRTYDLSTNAYFGAIHPAGYQALDMFKNDPWPTWRFAYDDVVVEKELMMVHGEDALVVSYTLVEAPSGCLLTVRPLLAFRDQHRVRLERDSQPADWRATPELVECIPFEDLPPLYIAHPNAEVETIGMWYRGFVYDRDRESHLDCIEDLYHSGLFNISISRGNRRSLLLATPSPRSLEMVDKYEQDERRRRRSFVPIIDTTRDPLFEGMLRSTDFFIYENLEGRTGILPGLPWGISEHYRGLQGFSGLLLVPRRFDVARKYLEGIAASWRENPSMLAFSPEEEVGQMHRADVPLWVFVAAWRFMKATDDREFLADILLPLLHDIEQYYLDGAEVRCADHLLIEVGHERDAAYEPIFPLGTNVLWFNAQMTFHALMKSLDPTMADAHHRRALQIRSALAQSFGCSGRPGFADAIIPGRSWRSESFRASQILSVGLPFSAVDNPAAVVDCLRERLATPYGPRTLSPDEPEYRGNGADIKMLPKKWYGSVDPGLFGLYCDALLRGGMASVTPEMFAPFEAELHMRCYGHISGAFAGEPPHEGSDYLASAAALGELLRIYARDILRVAHIV